MSENIKASMAAISIVQSTRTYICHRVDFLMSINMSKCIAIMAIMSAKASFCAMKYFSGP